MDDLISVIVPAFNTSSKILKCINSIINQSYKNIEILVIDDGSTDDTVAILNKNFVNEQKLKIISKQNGGVSSARNTGLNYCNGNFVFFVDADDYIEKDCLKVLYNEIKSNNCDVVKADYFFEGQKKPSIITDKLYDLADEKSRNQLYFEIVSTYKYNNVWGQLIRKSSLANIKFDENLKMAEDFKFNVMLYENCSKLKIISSKLYHYEYNCNGMNYNYSFNKVQKKVMDIESVNSFLYSHTNLPKNLILSRFINEFFAQLVLLAKYNYKLCKEFYLKCENSIFFNKNYFDSCNTRKEKYYFCYFLFAKKRYFLFYLYCKAICFYKFIQGTISHMIGGIK